MNRTRSLESRGTQTMNSARSFGGYRPFTADDQQLTRRSPSREPLVKRWIKFDDQLETRPCT